MNRFCRWWWLKNDSVSCFPPIGCLNSENGSRSVTRVTQMGKKWLIKMINSATTKRETECSSQATAPSRIQLTTDNAINFYLVAISYTLWVVLGAQSENQETPSMVTEALTSQHIWPTNINSPDTFISLMISLFVSLGGAARIQFNYRLTLVGTLAINK